MRNFNFEQLGTRELMAANILDAPAEPETVMITWKEIYVSSYQTGGSAGGDSFDLNFGKVPSFRGGVRVASGDVTGDGNDDHAAGARQGSTGNEIAIESLELAHEGFKDTSANDAAWSIGSL